MIDVRPEEVRVLGWCWLYIFSVLSSDYIIRPIRDQMGVAGGVENLQWLFTGSLVGMLAAEPAVRLAGGADCRAAGSSPSPTISSSSTSCCLPPSCTGPARDAAIWIGRVFFVWTSVFNLFVVSVFWQMNVDLFSPEQGKRLFGMIAAGATDRRHRRLQHDRLAGAPRLADLPDAGLRGRCSRSRCSASAACRACRRRCTRTAMASGRGEERSAAAFSAASSTPSARAISSTSRVFLLLFSLTSTFLYMQQAGIVSRSFSNRGAQITFFATVDLLVNVLTLVIQLFLTGRILLTLGVALSLGLLPALTIIGFGALALLPTIVAVAAFQVVRRAADYAIARPTRELLFTVVCRARTASRPRASSTPSSIASATRSAPGPPPCCAASAWAPRSWHWWRCRSRRCGWSTGLWLGRRQERMAKRQAASEAAPG